jgi:hypothetical protein
MFLYRIVSFCVVVALNGKRTRHPNRLLHENLQIGVARSIGTGFAILTRKGDSINMRKFGRMMGGSLLTLAFIFGISVASSATATAQYRNDGQYRRHDRDRDNDGDRHRDWRRHRNRDRDRDRDRIRERRSARYGDYNRNRSYGGYGNYGGYNNGSQYELNRGYQEGINTGSSDARRGQSYNPQRSHWWRDARTQAFREGFVRGYDQGFRQYAGYRNDRYGRRNTGGIPGGIFGRP